MEEAENLCNRIAIIHKGKIIENGEKKNILRKLESEALEFDVKSPLHTIPEDLKKFQAKISK
ncbi:hypothetical protein [Candidatus Venteria ishoeyi]|uniref:Uncharacterized protein n=1 Tax=Candidatus Venteria ishoeyi TaxID=1899563 RepID=A0A1H6F7M1_9GAMM|nr:hypothetical protein [Candidatus Venteria ishoeyi]SEH05319.1 Uncharacterised protein [Candidatus Venteria ishoeyi]